MPQPTLRLGTAEPADAFDAFVKRGDLAPTFRWHDLWQDDHAGKFMVAGVAQADVLRLLYDESARALREGRHLKDFQEALVPALKAKGWWGDVEITNSDTGEIRTTRFNPARLQLIYDTNLRISHAAGQWQAIQRGKARRPWLVYRTMRDERVRHSHAAWDGVCLPVDHPWWRTHYPPNGWRCRCRVIAVNDRELQRLRDMGVPIKMDAPPSIDIDHRDPRTGETLSVPLGIDPGWAYNPGQASLAQPAELLRRGLDGLPADLARAQVRQIVRGDDFARFLRAPRPGELQPVAVLGAERAQAIGARPGVAMIDSPPVPAPAGTAALTSADLAWVQQALDLGEAAPLDARTTAYTLVVDGWRTVVHLTRGAQGALRVTHVERAQAQAGEG